MEGLLVVFEEVRDPRRANARHDLASILFIAVAATLCGEKTCVDFADFAEGHLEALREIVELPHGPPSHDTFSRIFRVLDPAELGVVLTRFVSQMRQAIGLSGQRTVAIDGKSLNGAYEKGKACVPALMVNVWDNETRLAIAAVRAPDRNEAGAALEALKSLVLKGATVTGDALYCRPDMARVCRKRKAHYAFKLKANNPTLFKRVEDAFQKSGDDLAVFETTDRKRGRSETRRASVLDARELVSQDWPDLASVIRVRTNRRRGQIRGTNQIHDIGPALYAAESSGALPQSLGNRKQASLEARRDLRRRQRQIQKRSRTGKPRRHPPNRSQYSVGTSKRQDYPKENEARFLVQRLLLRTLYSYAIALPHAGGGKQ